MLFVKNGDIVHWNIGHSKYMIKKLISFLLHLIKKKKKKIFYRNIFIRFLLGFINYLIDLNLYFKCRMENNIDRHCRPKHRQDHFCDKFMHDDSDFNIAYSWRS